MVNSIKISDVVSRTGFTKVGFTKSGFSCCSRFDFCDMGKSVCFYNEIDPDAKNHCAAHLRNQKVKAAYFPPVTNVTESVVDDVELIEHENGQFSLF